MVCLYMMAMVVRLCSMVVLATVERCYCTNAGSLTGARPPSSHAPLATAPVLAITRSYKKSVAPHEIFT